MSKLLRGTVAGIGAAKQTVELDDQVAGFEGIQAGDRVILTLRNEPHHARVSSIVKSTERPRGTVAVPAPVLHGLGRLEADASRPPRALKASRVSAQ